MSDIDEKIKKLTPMKQDAVKRLDKLKEFFLTKVYKGYEDIYYGPSIDAILDKISDAKQCLVYGYNKDGKKIDEEDSGFDICYNCNRAFPEKILKEVNPEDFDIFCPKCKPGLYTKKEREEILSKEIKRI